MVEPALRRGPEIRAAEWLKLSPVAARIAFYGGPEAQAAIQPLWGPAFSQQACRASIENARATLWLGPEEYLLIELGGGETAASTMGGFEQALAAQPHALVDIGHRQFGIEISGPDASVILSGACPLDLHIDEFPVGMCTRTVLAKADIVLWRTAETAFRLEVWRSFAEYVSGILHEIASGLDRP